MKKVLTVFLLTIMLSVTANATFFDGPKSKCSPLSNAACNDNKDKK